MATRLTPRATGLLVAGMACFGSATPVSAIVGRTFPPLLASTLRLGLAAAVLVPVHLAAQRRGDEPTLTEVRHRLTRADWLRLAAIAVIGTFGFSVLMLLGMQRAPGAVASVVMATTPAVTAVGAVLFLGESPDRARGAAVLLAVVGVGLATSQSSVAAGTGDAVALGAALVFGAVVCEAAYSLLGKRLSVGLSPLAIVTAAATGAFLLFLPAAIWTGVRFDWASPSGGQWAGVMWWGLGTMALGSWLWFRGMATAPASGVAPFMAVMPVSALLLSYWLLDEPFRWAHAAGMAVVLAGLAIVVRSGAASH